LFALKHAAGIRYLITLQTPERYPERSNRCYPCTEGSRTLRGIPASHEVRDLGAGQCTHRFIKRLFEPSSSIRVTKSLRFLMMSRVHVFLAALRCAQV
jgi:hypothetical protein